MCPESNGADQHVRALLDQPLGAAAGGVDVRLGVGVHQLDVDAEPLLAARSGATSAPFWHDWPISACSPERGSSTPTFSFAASAFSRRGSADERQRAGGGDAERASSYGSHSCTPTTIMLPVLCAGAAAGAAAEVEAYTTS